MTTKVIINGQEVIGDVEFIRSLLGIDTVSARTETVKAEKSNKVKENNPKSNVRVRKPKQENKTEEYFDNANLVQVQERVVEHTATDVPNGYIATEYKKEYIENAKIYRISHSICGSAKYRDKITGEEKTRKFNSYPKKVANNEIKKLAAMPEFKGQMFAFKMPFTDGSGRSYTAWGFKSEDLADKALEILPKFVLKEQPKTAQ